MPQVVSVRAAGRPAPGARMSLVAAHLERAVENWRRWCRDQGIAVPAELFQLVAIVSNGPEHSDLGDSVDLGDDAGVPIAVTYSEAARLLMVSPSTINRLVRDERLATVAAGRARRIPRTELERFVAEQMKGPA